MMTAWLQAVRDRLRSILEYEEAECDVQSEGKPPAMAGDRYIAIHQGGHRNSGNNTLIEEYGVNVTVSLRGPHVPLDQWGRILILDATHSMESFVEDIVGVVHRKWELVQEANSFIDNSANGFIETMVFQNSDPEPRVVGADWFQAEGGGVVGLASTIRFFGGKRVRGVDG